MNVMSTRFRINEADGAFRLACTTLYPVASRFDMYHYHAGGGVEAKNPNQEFALSLPKFSNVAFF